MDAIKIFSSPQFGQLRINVNADGEPWFCLADVCKVLELNGVSFSSPSPSITINEFFSRYMATICVGAARGVIAANLKYTWLEKVVLPPINLTQIFTGDISFRYC